METLDQLIDVSPSPGYDLDKRTLLGNLLLNPMCTEMERIHLLNSIGEHFSLDLYTQSDTSPLKNIRLRGIASSLDGMPKVFKCSKINLNLTAKGIQSGASLRIFDVLETVFCSATISRNYRNYLKSAESLSSLTAKLIFLIRFLIICITKMNAGKLLQTVISESARNTVTRRGLR